MAGKKINKTWLIVLFVVLFLVAIAIVVYVIKPKASANTPPNPNINTNTPPGYDPNTGAPSGFPLKKGSENSYVAKLQQYMLTRDAGCLPVYGVDGKWGSETEACANKTLGLDVVNYDFYKSLGLS